MRERARVIQTYTAKWMGCEVHDQAMQTALDNLIKKVWRLGYANGFYMAEYDRLNTASSTASSSQAS